MPARGLVERYTLHRWRECCHPIGNMGEFFEFEDRRHVLAEFTRLGGLDPSELEREIVAAPGQLPQAIAE